MFFEELQEQFPFKGTTTEQTNEGGKIVLTVYFQQPFCDPKKQDYAINLVYIHSKKTIFEIIVGSDTEFFFLKTSSNCFEKRDNPLIPFIKEQLQSSGIEPSTSTIFNILKIAREPDEFVRTFNPTWKGA